MYNGITTETLKKLQKKHNKKYYEHSQQDSENR